MICCSIIRGSGRPKLGIFIHFAFYYCGALPLGITFASYAFTFGLEGRMSKSLQRLTVSRGSAMGREMRNLLFMQGIADPVYSAHWFSFGFCTVIMTYLYFVSSCVIRFLVGHYSRTYFTGKLCSWKQTSPSAF